ncbi:Alkali-sensitive linkage protein 1 [Fulvia fulva]|uniref:Alkali-sensitive linkage protein 1 n=1 Tax=Passalora fulva TaxID=5499 RepID=A0A9Q8PFM7_PASFU|nr:Alkali-sensitive linkage protein 1 [Fulvia fulva]KAK4613328.1 Alkali-sensitive linkage protein 1 [Fulvia fulva]KAK4615039.1 Alkali-sensitive linkage protein 1 [Fulvia fulva]UJO21606.1 Alkali-sensitive linkage protein 1 [Fulvia fulva]WPV20757.1 Alkali-sensitive linkage protein 1 [Fulvia fulva]WPV34788.1 Alkali-sensitive linkage protein 1 [Fulvia fulva]
MRTSIVASILSLPLALAEQAVLTSTKRGLVYVETENKKDDHFWTSASDIRWYYNYESEPTSQLNNKLEFVPMLWGAGSDSNFYTTVKDLKDGGMNVSYVLAFDEPDGCGQVYGGSCVDAQTAAEMWKQQIEPLKDLGIKLGGPTVTSAPTGFTWLQNFFMQCAGGCSVDFLPVHYYGDFQGLASHIGQVNATYQNISTMWVTEYGLPNQDLEVAQDFYNQSSAFLNRVPYIQRYSYFGSFRSDVSNVGPNAAMLTQKGELTDIGAWYLGDAVAATGNIPKGDAVQLAKFAGWMMMVVAVSFYCIA